MSQENIKGINIVFRKILSVYILPLFDVMSEWHYIKEKKM